MYTCYVHFASMHIILLTAFRDLVCTLIVSYSMTQYWVGWRIEKYHRPYLLLLESCILNHVQLSAFAISFSIRDSDTETI